MTTHHYRPRMLAVLEVPVYGPIDERKELAASRETVKIPVRCQRATLTSNDHNQPDELELTVDWADAGVDPRLLSSAVVYFWMGDAGQSGHLAPSPETLRFVGVTTDIERSLSDSGKEITMKFDDFTAFFLRSKPFPASGLPNFSMTLKEAWELICENTGYYDIESDEIYTSVAGLSSRIVSRGDKTDLNAPIGAHVGPRFAKLGKVQPKPGSSAWDVWMQIVGSLGLFSFIRKQDCVVCDAAAYYTDDTIPRFIWGRNILSMRERRDTREGGKRLMVSGFDAATHSILEAYYPPRDAGIRVKKPGKPKKGDDGLVPIQNYEPMPYIFEVADQAALDSVAKRAWEEKQRQELTGTITTAEMFVDTMSNSEADLLELVSGDVIRVEFEEDVRGALSQLDPAQRETYLIEVAGYQPRVARLLTRSYDSFGALKPEFCVRSVKTTLEVDDKGGSYEVEINYVNRIQESGGTYGGASTP